MIIKLLYAFMYKYCFRVLNSLLHTNICKQAGKLALVNDAIYLYEMHQKMYSIDKETPKIKDVIATTLDVHDLQHKHDNFNTVISHKRSTCDKLCRSICLACKEPERY